MRLSSTKEDPSDTVHAAETEFLVDLNSTRIFRVQPRESRSFGRNTQPAQNVPFQCLTTLRCSLSSVAQSERRTVRASGTRGRKWCLRLPLVEAPLVSTSLFGLLPLAPRAFLGPAGTFPVTRYPSAAWPKTFIPGSPDNSRETRKRGTDGFPGLSKGFCAPPRGGSAGLRVAATALTTQVVL